MAEMATRMVWNFMMCREWTHTRSVVQLWDYRNRERVGLHARTVCTADGRKQETNVRDSQVTQTRKEGRTSTPAWVVDHLQRRECGAGDYRCWLPLPFLRLELPTKQCLILQDYHTTMTIFPKITYPWALDEHAPGEEAYLLRSDAVAVFPTYHSLNAPGK